MKKSLLFVSMIAALCITGCNTNQGDSKSASNPESSQPSEASNSGSNSEESSNPSSSSEAPKEEVKNDNFTLLNPNNLSSMSPNCKKYVDDMRNQQKKLLQEKGANADYYLNDLYGTAGVDITKGIPDGDNGGYRPANHQSDYLDPVAAEWEKGEKSDESKGIEIEFTPADSLKNKEYTITFCKEANLSDGKQIKTNDTKAYLKNLLVNQKYYYKVTADGKDSQVASFTTGDYPRWIDARPMFNVRDMGGYMTSSGQRIKQGLVYRGGEITPAVGWKSGAQYSGDIGGRYTDSNGRMQDGHITSQTDASKKAFREDMGMINGLEIDLRSGSETNGYPSKSGYCNFAENNDISYSLIPISSYDGGMQKNKTQIKQVFEAFAKADQHPVYYHCYGGADRTGVVGFMLGAVLGMSYTDLVIDFELTSYSSNPSRNYRSHLRNGPWNEWPGMVDYLKGTLGWEKDCAQPKTIKQGM